MRQLLTESVVLATVGGLVGLLIAAWGTSALGDLARLYLPRARDIGIDQSGARLHRLSHASSPALDSGSSPRSRRRARICRACSRMRGAGASAGAPRNRVRGALVVMEVAVALVLLAGAGLLLRSFQRLISVETGFNPEHLLALQVWLPVQNDPAKGRYFTDAQRRAFYDRAQAAVAQVPGVRQVALVSRLPYRGRGDTSLRDRGPADPARPAVAGGRGAAGDARVLPDDADPHPARPHARGGGRFERPRRGRDQPDHGEQVLAGRGPDRSPRFRSSVPRVPMVTIVGVVGRRAPGGAGPAARGRSCFSRASAFPARRWRSSSAPRVTRAAWDPR